MEGSSKNRRYDRRTFDDPLDRRISERAADQHGTVSVRQLESLGISASAVRDRVAGGRLHRVYSGVVAVMAPSLLTRKGSIMAATLACRPGTLACKRAASALFGLRLAQGGWVDVTTPGVRGHRRMTSCIAPTAAAAPSSYARSSTSISSAAPRQQRPRRSVSEDRPRDRPSTRRRQRLDRVPRRQRRRSSSSTASRTSSSKSTAATPTPTARPSTQTAARDARLMLLGWRVVRFTWQQVEHDPAYVAATQGCWSELRTQPRGRTRSARARRPRCAPARSRSSPPRARASPCPARSRGPRSSRRPYR